MPAEVPNGQTVWAIGDIHGRLDLLDPLLNYIVAESRKCHDQIAIVFLGDYIDRGPDSKTVIERIWSLKRDSDFEVHLIRGNHEDSMQTFLDDPRVGVGWCKFGGKETLRSFGLDTPLHSHRKEAWRSLSLDLEHSVTEVHRSFFRSLESFIIIGGYFFTHAGARPGVDLDKQTAHDLMWIRDHFLSDTEPFALVIVHGHSPADYIHSDARRIGIDTGAYKSGVLSAVRLQRGARTFVQAVDVREGSVLIRTNVDSHSKKFEPS
jgi:serine/threonine protein phosphatase 1